MKNNFFIFVVLFLLGNITPNCFASGNAEQDAAFFGAVGGLVGSLIDDAIESNKSKSSSGSNSGGSSGIAYYYTISSGYFKADDFSEYCTAGADGYVNDVKSVNLVNLGPLPPGTYSITGVQQTLNGSPHNNVIVLEMISGNSYGRRDFRIHGARTDGTNGSNGCILMSPQNRQKIASDFYNYGRGTLYVSE